MGYDPNSPLPKDQDGTLQAILLVLEQIANNMPTINLGTKAQRVNVETLVGLPTTTLGGMLTTVQTQQDWNAAALGPLYSNIKVT